MNPAAPNGPAGFVVGLTGGIASGKSAVAEMFRALGATIVDTDVLAREVVEPGTEGLAAVVEAFGAQILTEEGRLDRAAMRRRIFTDEEARRRLEAILHPLIWARTRTLCEAAFAETDEPGAAAAPYVIAVVPLLAEGGRTERFDRILVVDCPPALQIERLIARDGGTTSDARRILASQASREARLALADDVITNDGTLESLAAQVNDLHGSYVALGLLHGREAQPGGDSLP